MVDVIQSISHTKKKNEEKTEKSLNLMEMALSIGGRHAFNITLVDDGRATLVAIDRSSGGFMWPHNKGNLKSKTGRIEGQQN